MSPATRRKQAGFSFIEILVVMGIISVLVSMVVLIIPTIQERSNQTKSKDNVKNMITMMMMRVTSKGVHGWPPYSGKNFVLSLVARGQIDMRRSENLETLFSPGDGNYGLGLLDIKQYENVKKDALKRGDDFHNLTSYAGRRNGDKEYRITADQMKMGTLVICDDDDGAVHHPNGIVAGYSDGSVTFKEWDEWDMVKPEDPDSPEPFLGDDASNDELMKMYGK
jgi:prepilin-type N-terminal cleavage/methylation domain-containing protein